MERRFAFNGTGLQLFLKMLVGTLLCVVTLGIYAPWFMVNLTRYVCQNTLFKTEKEDVSFDFKGTGGPLFVICLIGVLLTTITFGIYGAWFGAKLTRFFCDNITGTTQDGTAYSLRFNGTGGQLFVICLIGVLLTMITFGIFAPWFACKLMKFFSDSTDIIRSGSKAGRFDFVGKGGELFLTYLVGCLLTFVTFGIYGSWFMVKLFKYFNGNTEIDFQGQRYIGAFDGTGGEFFIINLVGSLLSAITFGIYGAWYMVKQIRFEWEHTIVRNKA